MFFLALAVGVAVGAVDDESEWRSKDEKKSIPVRSLADDWDDDSARQANDEIDQAVAAADHDASRRRFRQADSPSLKNGMLRIRRRSPKRSFRRSRSPSSRRGSPHRRKGGEDESGLRAGQWRPVAAPGWRNAGFQTDDGTDSGGPKDEPKPSSTSALPELPKGLSTNQPPVKTPKVLEIGPNETQTKDPDEAHSENRLEEKQFARNFRNRLRIQGQRRAADSETDVVDAGRQAASETDRHADEEQVKSRSIHRSANPRKKNSNFRPLRRWIHRSFGRLP